MEFSLGLLTETQRKIKSLILDLKKKSGAQTNTHLVLYKVSGQSTM